MDFWELHSKYVWWPNLGYFVFLENTKACQADWKLNMSQSESCMKGIVTLPPTLPVLAGLLPNL